ncbi:MAG: hypothetical protein ACJATI_005103 [Halioglobus sp.]|jgi:hypothetical protein
MKIEEFLKYKDELIEASKDEDNFYQASMILSEILPLLVESKAIDSEDWTETYLKNEPHKIQVNGYCINESQERLQLFILKEDTLGLSNNSKSKISTKASYTSEFKKVKNFITKSLKRQLNDILQDSDSARALVSKIGSNEGIYQFDVIEIFLVSLSATISSVTQAAKSIEFEDYSVETNFTHNRQTKTKSILVKQRLIDLNFLYEVATSQGNRQPLVINFAKLLPEGLNVIKAADEKHFESYLCVLPGSLIAALYKDHSTRLLEKNVRSFLQFRGVNKGIKDTIRKEPEKFVAYNNGLTITATEAVLNDIGDSIISLTDFQIVNGGQTTATIYFSKKEGLDISKIKVMAKINVVKQTTIEELDELISNISTYSNAQSRVSKVDLRSRNPQLVALKTLSDSVVTPKGKKWFFERSKGQYNTMIRIAGKNKAQQKKKYPNERKFSKEQLAKYYCSWGDTPYIIKKGGEKVFRIFIEEIDSKKANSSKILINRFFYERVIAKVILFRRLEKIYGQGKNSMGQLRSAVVPYSISVLHHYTDYGEKYFDLGKIWTDQSLSENLEEVFRRLMMLMNDLIKKYSDSDDFGEYSKKKELWQKIINSVEVSTYMDNESIKSTIGSYIMSDEEVKVMQAQESVKDIDFSLLHGTLDILDIGDEYFRSLKKRVELTDIERRKLDTIIKNFVKPKVLKKPSIDFHQYLITKFRQVDPDWLTEITQKRSYRYLDTLNNILGIYYSTLNEGLSLKNEYKTISAKAKKKKVAYSIVFDTIGDKLTSNESPDVVDVINASNYYFTEENKNTTGTEAESDLSKVKITANLARTILEWESTSKILSRKQMNYVVDFAYGTKPLNNFHREAIRGHLKRLVEKGFKL